MKLLKALILQQSRLLILNWQSCVKSQYWFRNPREIIGWLDKKGNKLKFDAEGYSECGKYLKLNNDIYLL